MSRPNNQKNYAQAAAQPKSHINNTHHQNQQHHHQQSSQQNQTSGTPASSNFTPSANGKSNKSQTKPQAQHNSTMGNGNTGRSAPIKQKNPVQLPTNGHAWEKASKIEFGSEPSTQLSTSTGPTLKSGGGIPATLPTKMVPSFGTLSNATTQTTQAAQAIQTSTTVGTTGPGANNNNNISNNNNNNGVSKSISARSMDIPPRTHSAPPQFQDNRNVGQSGHIPNVGPTRTSNIHQQQSAAVSHQPSSVSVSNPTLNHRKDSVSSTVSSNDGQQQQFHPHHSTHHPNHSRHYGHHNKGNMPPNQYRPRDKNNISQHLNSAQPVPAQGSIPITPMYINYRPEYHNLQYYPYHHPNMVLPYSPHYTMHPRPPMTQPHIPQTPPVNNTYKNTAKQSKAIDIIDPTKNAPINIQLQMQPKVSHKREEAPIPVFEKKSEESEKEKPSSEDKSNSKAVPIIDPADKDKEERERKEQERIAKEKEKAEQERKEREEREERERLEAERKEKEEKERKEREEKERLAKEKEEQERRELEERERKEREEQERIAKEKEERERKERERLEAERKEKEEKERREREERERLEKEKKEKEEKERKEREEKERKEREEKERLEKEKKEKEEKERKEREEKERLEKEKKEKEEKERKEREEKERLEKERLEAVRKEEEEKARKQQEEKEKEEVERKKKEEEEAKAKAASEDEKKKEAESVDSKKEEKKFSKGHRPGPLDLSRTTSAPAIPSALGSARIIDDLNSVQYPEGILSPNPALNSNAEPGKFKYDRNFLMQFMGVCKEKPEHLPALEAIGMEEPKDDKKRPARNGSTNSRSSIHKSSPTQFQMGEFKSPLKTSEERFAMSNMRNGTSSGAGIFGGRAPLGRTGSGSTLLPAPGAMSSTTTQSPSRTLSGRVPNRRGGKGSHQMQGPNVGHEQVAPLERSENRWVPPTMVDLLPKANESSIPIDGIQRKVKALLNKLTLEKFDSISDQIIDHANKSRDEKDGRILREVIRLIFEKSCDESNFCAMYAQLCRKMMERVDPEIVDENVKNTEGKFVQGGTLFRKYLLNRCQEDFEKGWKVNVPVPSNEKGEPDLMSDEYYVAARAKRQGLGLIRFIGELFKLNMLTERIMHECIKKLLIFQGSPEEEEMESLCKLMNTVGEQLDHVKTNPHEHIKQNQIDHAKAKQLMESYFNRMEEISKLPNLSSRIKFMIMDVIDLRSNSWKPRRDINAPKTIAEIHEDAAKQKEEAEFLRRTASSGGRLPKMAEQMSRSGSGRRDHRSDKGMAPHGSSASSNDGWINVGGTSQRNKDKVGDLTKFGSVNRSKITGNVSLAPGGILTGLSGGAKGWNSEKDGKNMYSVLTSESSEGRKSSETPSSEVQKSSPPTERKKIILAPRTKAIPTEEPQAITKSTLKSNSEGASSVQSMPEELAKKKINGMTDEYFSIRDVKEVAQCLKEIPTEYHATAIENFANKVIEKKPKDVDNVMTLFKELVSTGTCELDAFKNGFRATLDFLMEIGADAPMAYSFTGQLLFSTGLDFRDITKLLKQLDDDKAVEKIVRGYASALKKDDEQKYVQKIREFDFISLFPKKNKDDINKYLEDLVR